MLKVQLSQRNSTPSDPDSVEQKPVSLEQFKASLSKYLGSGTRALITQPPLYDLAKRLLGMPSFADMLDEIYKHTLELCSQKNPSGMPIDREFASILEASLILRQDQSQQPEDILWYANILMPCMISMFDEPDRFYTYNTIRGRTISALSHLMPLFSRQQRKATLIHLEWRVLSRFLPDSDNLIQAIKQLKREWYPAWGEVQDKTCLEAKRAPEALLATETKHAADIAINDMDPQVLINKLRQQLAVQTNDTRIRFNVISSLAFVGFKTPPTLIQAGEIIDILAKQFHCEYELSDVEVKKIEEIMAKQPSTEKMTASVRDSQESYVKPFRTAASEHHLVMRKLLSALVDLPFAIPSSHEQMVVDMVIAGLSHHQVSSQAWEVLKDVPFASLSSQKKRLIDEVLALINKDIDRWFSTSHHLASLILFYPLLTGEDPRKETIFKRLMDLYTDKSIPHSGTKDNIFETLSSIFPYLPTHLKTTYVQEVIKIFERRDFGKFYAQTLIRVVAALMTADNRRTISFPEQAKLLQGFLEFCFADVDAKQRQPIVLELLKALPSFYRSDVRSIASYVFQKLADPNPEVINYTTSLLPPIYAALPSGEVRDDDEIKLEDLAAYQVETSLLLSNEAWDLAQINSQRELRAALLEKFTTITDRSTEFVQSALVGIAITMNQQQFVALIDELELFSDRLIPIEFGEDLRTQNGRLAARADIRETIYALYEAQPTFVNSQQTDKISSSLWPHLRHAIMTKFELEESIKQLHERINEYDNRDQDEAALAADDAAEIERRDRFEHETAIEKLNILRRFIKCMVATLIVLLAKVPPEKQDPIMLEILESMFSPDEEIAFHVLEIIEERSFYFPKPQKSRLANALMTRLQTSLSNDQRVAIIAALVAIYPAESDTLAAFYATLIKELEAVSEKDVWLAAAQGLARSSHLMSQMQGTACVKQLMSSLTRQGPVHSEVEFSVMHIMLICFPYQLSSADRGKFFVKICDISKWITVGLADGIEATIFLENLISYLTEIPQEDLVTLAQQPREILQFMQRVLSPEYTAHVHDLFPKMFAALPNEIALLEGDSSSLKLASKKRKRAEEVIDREAKQENNGSQIQLPPTNGVAQPMLPPKLMLCENLLKLLEDKSNATRDAAYDALAKIVSQVDVTWQNKLKERLCFHFAGTEKSEVRLNLFKLLGIIYSAQQTQPCLTEFVPKDVAPIVTSYMFSSSLQP